MMTLYSAPPSPFGRKVRIAAAMLGLGAEMWIESADVADPHDRIRALNPLGKIPALVRDDGTVLYDSAVIVDYLDHRAGGTLIPTGPARFEVLTRQALADGLVEAAVLQVYEKRFRTAERREPAWLAHQAAKIERALTAFEQTPPAGRRSVADVALACALGYLDLRFPGTWRDIHPRLVEWLDLFAAEIPSFEATRFTG